MTPKPPADLPMLELPRRLWIPAAASPGAKTEGIFLASRLLIVALLVLPLPLSLPGLLLPSSLPFMVRATAGSMLAQIINIERSLFMLRSYGQLRSGRSPGIQDCLLFAKWV